jgi:hypothetical protein
VRPERRRTSQEPERPRESDEQPRRQDERASVLELQRTAGNAAVAAWLGPGRSPVLARRTLPEDADALEEVASAAKEITIDTTVMSIGQLKPWLTATTAERDGYSVDVRFAGSMTKTGASADDEKKVNNALNAIAKQGFNLHTGAEAAAKLDTVRFADLDFSPFGGVEGHYRFTCVTRKPKKGKADAEIVLIIELVRAPRAAFKSWKDLDKDRRAALDARFSKFSFKKGEPDLKRPTLLTWLDDQWAAILQALEAIPDDALAAVPGIEWMRGRGKLGPTGEAGHFEYDPNEKSRTLTLYDDAFASDDFLVGLVAHELGHALSYKPPSEKQGATSVATGKAFKDAAAADGKAITAYGGTDPEELYAESYSMFIAEPETMRVLRPKLFEFFTKNPSGQPPPPPPKPAAKAKAGVK